MIPLIGEIRPAAIQSGDLQLLRIIAIKPMIKCSKKHSHSCADGTADNVGLSHFPATSAGARAVGAQAVGTLVIASVAVGTLAIGVLAIGRLVIGRARIRRLEIDELIVGDLRITGRLETPSDSPSSMAVPSS
jgi:hypothetical protein